MDNKYQNLFRNIIFLILVLIAQYSCQKRLYIHQKKNIVIKPLYDLFHSLLGEAKNGKINTILCTKRWGMADCLTGITSYFIIFYLLYKKDIEILSNFFYACGILFLLRIVTFSLTTLPTPKNCNAPPFVLGGCGDLLYSGHYIWFTVSMYIILKKTNIKRIFKIFFVICYIVSIYSTLVCRNHYSIDIFIAIMLSYLISSVIIK